MSVTHFMCHQPFYTVKLPEESYCLVDQVPIEQVSPWRRRDVTFISQHLELDRPPNYLGNIILQQNLAKALQPTLSLLTQPGGRSSI